MVEQSTPILSSSSATKSGQGFQAPLGVPEKLVLGLLAAAVIWTCWALGSVHAWVQAVAASLILVAFLLAWWPSRGEGSSWRRKAFRLFRFPVFWGGGLFLLYLLAGALNPDARAFFLGPVWWVEDQAAVAWLPGSVDAPFLETGRTVGAMNAWRALLFFGSGWLLACAGWMALSRRGWRVLLTILAVNVALQAVFAMALGFQHAKEIYPFYESGSTSPPMGSFIYQNHGAAYLNLGLTVVLFLALRDLSRRNPGDDGPYLLLGALALFVTFVQAYSLSVLGMMGTIFLMVAGAGLFFRVAGRALLTLPVFISSSLLLVLLAILIPSLHMSKIEEQLLKVEQMLAGQSADPRLHLPDAVTAMIAERPLYGWGGGSFRWRFRPFQQADADLGALEQGRPLLYRYAHSDPLQFAAEYGAVGVAIVLGTFLFCLRLFWRQRKLWQEPEVMLASGLFVLLLHSTLDFPLYNHAILLFAATMATFLLSRFRERTSNPGALPSR